MSAAAVLDDYLDGLLADAVAPVPAARPEPSATPVAATGAPVADGVAGPVAPDDEAGVEVDAGHDPVAVVESASDTSAEVVEATTVPAVEVAPETALDAAAVVDAPVETPAVPEEAAPVVGVPVIDAAPAPAPAVAVPPIGPAAPAPAVARAPVPAPAPVAPRPRSQAVPAAPHPPAVDLQRPAPAVPSAHQQRRVSDHSSRWLRLRCGVQPYGLELLKVQEVVLPTPLLPLRGTPAAMLGVMNLRGQVVPVMDLGVHLGQSPLPSSPATRIVVLEEGGETLGLRVSCVEDVVTLGQDQIESPENARVGRVSAALFRGVARLQTEPMILLDASALLTPAESRTA
ncbi:chemotaxis protein CheW [Xanthomonas sp. XNM01]|uniref:chemotaxis protein CheW n=1 Tax=Xanthomonas sp. XNM01 TaxID=2769289 RepID=UPI00177F8327|nr:chemotaxis protein CheW [Xanthomonas sp. XNM01]MBD9368277.1 purine-binding chemotaxis protein CheW [Xanthomonas sp. XNM01]